MKNKMILYSRLICFVLLMSSILLLLPTSMLSAASNTAYSNASSWAIETLDRAVKYNLITNRISSDMKAEITREEYAELAVRVYEALSGKTVQPSAKSFPDTDNPEILKAVNIGIINGYPDGTFGPKKAVTREQMAKMFYNMILALKPTEKTTHVQALDFIDKDTISSWALEAVGYAVTNNIITGKSGKIFDPLGKATREQAVIIFTKTYEKLNSIAIEVKPPQVNTQTVHESQKGLNLPQLFPKNIPFTSDAKIYQNVDESNETAGSQSISILYTTKKSINDISSMYSEFIKGRSADFYELKEDGYILIGTVGSYTLSVTVMEFDGYMVAVSILPDGGTFTDYHTQVAAEAVESGSSNAGIKVNPHDTSFWRISATALSGDNCPTNLAIVKDDGTVWGFGIGITLEDENDPGYCSDTGTKTPIQLASGIKSVETIPGTNFTFSGRFYIKSNGDLVSEGSDECGRLGNGEVDGVWYKYFGQKVILSNVRFVTSSSGKALAITKNNELYHWGSNCYKTISDSDTSSYATPQKLMDNVVSAAVSDHAIFAVKTDGTLLSWGSSGYGQLGDKMVLPERSVKAPFKVMDGVKEVYASRLGTVAAIKTDGSLWMWGNNFYGQLGNGKHEAYGTDYSDVEKTYTPVKVMDNVKKVDISDHTIVLKTDGSVWVWGDNQDSQCGVSSDEVKFVVKPRKLTDNAIDIAACDGHSFVLKSDGYLWGCGKNTDQYALMGKGDFKQAELINTGLCIK